MRKFITVVIAAIALTAASTAAADPVSVQPLRDAGYTVGVAFEPSAGCTVWAVSGHGLSTYVNDCDPDVGTTIASLADPTLIFERDWQANHPEQVEAAATIASRCYSISRTAAGVDSWRVVGGPTDLTASGGDLVGLASSLPDLRQQDGACPTGTVVVVVPGTDGTTTTVPGAPTVTAAIETQAQTIAAANAAAARPEAIQAANAAAEDAFTAAVASGADSGEAALAARSAGLNALYDLSS